MNKKILILGVSLFALCFLFAAVSQADWYKCKIDQVNQANNGEVRLLISPGVGQAAYVGGNTTTGQAIVRVGPDVPARNQYLALFYTALSMEVEVELSLAAEPTWDTVNPLNINRAKVNARNAP